MVGAHHVRFPAFDVPECGEIAPTALARSWPRESRDLFVDHLCDFVFTVQVPATISSQEHPLPADIAVRTKSAFYTQRVLFVFEVVDACFRIRDAFHFVHAAEYIPPELSQGIYRNGVVRLCYPLPMTERGRLVLRTLTDREQKVLALVASGLSNKTIAERFGTTEQVIKNNMRFILQKAGRRNRCELIVFAYRHGVVECPCKRRGASLQDANGASCADVSVSAP